MKAPDSPSAIKAFRMWGTTGGADVLLQSTAAGFLSAMPAWRPGIRFEAECLSPGRCPDDGIPGMRHRCGIYAFKAIDDCLEWARHMGRARTTVVIGEVWLWGTVVESALGWRAQYAYPAALLDARVRRGRDVDLDRLAALYGIPRTQPVAA